MSQPIHLDQGRQAHLLCEAVHRRTPATVTCRAEDGWVSLKSRILDANPDTHHLVIEYPWSPEPPVVEIAPGQSLGISFRHGHKKCVFNSAVLTRCGHALGGETVPAVTLAWPDEMCELQRRVYFRSPVPQGMTIPVELWRGQVDETASPGMPTCRGRMLDLSAGGVSVVVARRLETPWQDDEPVRCAFPVDSDNTLVSVSARLRHFEETPNDQMRIGLHFVGLDASPDDRQTLQRVIRLCGRLQRAGSRSDRRLS